MAFSVWILALAAFLSGAAASIFALLVIGIHAGDHARNLADEPGMRLDALTRSALGVGVRADRPAANSGSKENDRSNHITKAIPPCQ